MITEVEPLISWLRRQRRMSEIQLVLMNHHFDLDGALAAGQPELAWRTREVILGLGIEFYLRSCGVNPPLALDHVGALRTWLRHLAAVSPALADRAWHLLLRPLPENAAALRVEIAAALEFLRQELSLPWAVSRAEAIRAWATGLRLLRSIGQGLGVSASDEWYILEGSADGRHLDWYDEVIDVVGRQV